MFFLRKSLLIAGNFQIITVSYNKKSYAHQTVTLTEQRTGYFRKAYDSIEGVHLFQFRSVINGFKVQIMNSIVELVRMFVNHRSLLGVLANLEEGLTANG